MQIDLFNLHFFIISNNNTLFKPTNSTGNNGYTFT